MGCGLGDRVGHRVILLETFLTMYFVHRFCGKDGWGVRKRASCHSRMERQLRSQRIMGC